MRRTVARPNLATSAIKPLTMAGFALSASIRIARVSLAVSGVPIRAVCAIRCGTSSTAVPVAVGDSRTMTHQKALLYRMVLPDHVCPFGVASLELLQREGFEVDDHQLKTREETEALKEKLGV